MKDAKGTTKGGVEFFPNSLEGGAASAASIVKALTWHKTISPLTGSLHNEYAQIVPAVLKKFLFHLKNPTGLMGRVFDKDACADKDGK